MPVLAKTRNKKNETFEKILISQRDQLNVRVHGRLNEVSIEREPDDEAASAIDNITKDMAVAALERERRTLQEIEAALVRMKKGSYGLCASCGEPIAEARLKALPWARTCIDCAAGVPNSSAAD